jgi:hypothetical protein
MPVLFKKRWSDGLHNDFEHVDEFESKFGLFGGDGGDDGGGGGSPDNSYSDMFGSADSYSAAPDNSYSDMFGSVDSYSAAPAAATPSVDTFAEIAPQQSYNPFTVAEEIAAKNRAAQQPELMAAVSGAPDRSYLSESAISKSFGSISPSGAYQAATAPPSSGVQIGVPEFNIGGKEFTFGSVPNQPGVGLVAKDPFGLGGRAGITANLNNIGVGYALPLKDGGIVSLLRR